MILGLEDCLYVPNVCRNLIFAIYLGKYGYCVILNDNVVIKKDKMFICSGSIVDGLYILTPDKHELYNSELDNNSHVKSLKGKFPSTIDAYLLHLRWVILIQTEFKDLIGQKWIDPLW